MTKLDDIKARLAAATPGPWWVEDRDGDMGEKNHVVYASGDICSLYEMARPRAYRKSQHADALLIAYAPADLAWLIARAERLELQHRMWANYIAGRFTQEVSRRRVIEEARAALDEKDGEWW